MTTDSNRGVTAAIDAEAALGCEGQMKRATEMTIIPANPGFELLCYGIECGELQPHPPRPILAWRTTNYGPIPISLGFSFKQMTPEDYFSMRSPEGVMPSVRYAVRHGGTIYDASIGGEFDSEEEWREWLLTQAEARWEKLKKAIKRLTTQDVRQYDSETAAGAFWR